MVENVNGIIYSQQKKMDCMIREEKGGEVARIEQIRGSQRDVVYLG
jgi:hypothetical protein